MCLLIRKPPPRDVILITTVPSTAPFDLALVPSMSVFQIGLVRLVILAGPIATYHVIQRLPTTLLAIAQLPPIRLALVGLTLPSLEMKRNRKTLVYRSVTVLAVIRL